MKILVIFNPKSGPENLVIEEVKKEIYNSLNNVDNTNYEIEFIDITETPIDSEKINKDSKNIKAIIIAGGDGTISKNIHLVVNNNILLGIIPKGTFNNFAKDNDLPEIFSEALEVIKEFNTLDIDAGKLNEIYFINNSSIGLYTKSVKEREKAQKKYNLEKMTAMSLAILRVFYLFPMIYLEGKTKGVRFKQKTPYIFIGNNKYDFDILNFGSRPSLKGGELFLYYSKCKNRLCLIKIVIKTLFGSQTNEKDFISKPIKHITISSRRRIINVAADGELYDMESPLEYKILPKAIKLIVPRK